MALLAITVAFVFSHNAFATWLIDHWPDVAGPYLGQEPPGIEARIFAPGIISTERSEINSVFCTRHGRVLLHGLDKGNWHEDNGHQPD